MDSFSQGFSGGSEGLRSPPALEGRGGEGAEQLECLCLGPGLPSSCRSSKDHFPLAFCTVLLSSLLPTNPHLSCWRFNIVWLLWVVLLKKIINDRHRRVGLK